MADPASPEGMLRSYHGENDTGLSAIREKPVDDRSVFQQTRDYLNKGINEDAYDALGPHAAPALIGLGSLLSEIFGPGADVIDAVTASGETTQAVKEGDILGAGVGGLNTLASLAMIALPGSVGGAKKITEEVTKQGKRAKLFQDLADEQRGAPEMAMVEAQGKLGGGVLSHAIEHVGDLTHRMTDKYDNFKGYGYDVGNKVDSVLRSLRSEYGFEKEFNENIRAASSYKGIPENRFRDTATKSLQRYADAHKNLRVYNEPQKLARDAAVALGEQRFKDAEELLSKLQNLIKGEGVTAQSGENISDAYRRAAGEFDPEFEKTIKKKKGGSVIERNPYNYPPKSI